MARCTLNLPLTVDGSAMAGLAKKHTNIRRLQSDSKTVSKVACQAKGSGGVPAPPRQTTTEYKTQSSAMPAIPSTFNQNQPPTVVLVFSRPPSKDGAANKENRPPGPVDRTRCLIDSNGRVQISNAPSVAKAREWFQVAVRTCLPAFGDRIEKLVPNDVGLQLLKQSGPHKDRFTDLALVYLATHKLTLHDTCHVYRPVVPSAVELKDSGTTNRFFLNKILSSKQPLAVDLAHLHLFACSTRLLFETSVKLGSSDQAFGNIELPAIPSDLISSDSKIPSTPTELRSFLVDLSARRAVLPPPTVCEWTQGAKSLCLYIPLKTSTTTTNNTTSCQPTILSAVVHIHESAAVLVAGIPSTDTADDLVRRISPVLARFTRLNDGMATRSLYPTPPANLARCVF